MIEDHLKGRFSSLFDVTGPLAELEDDEQDAATRANASSSEQDDFDFLDNPNGSENGDEIENSMDNSDNETNEAQRATKGALSTSTRDEDVLVHIPDHWYQTTVNFSHPRIRDYLTTEGD